MGRTKLDGGGGKVMRKNPARIEVKSSPKQAVVNADRSGDWMASDELRAAALSAVEAGSDVTLQLGGIDHLDASALQICWRSTRSRKGAGGNSNWPGHLRNCGSGLPTPARLRNFSLTESKGNELDLSAPAKDRLCEPSSEHG